jgi:hypothetical protein
MDEAAGQPAVLVRRRALIPFFAAALSVAGVFALTARRRDPVATETNLSSLYHCKNGDPGVATRYENGEWGTVTGDWYILAQTTDAGTYDCGRMIFGLRGSDDQILRQEMLYVGTSDDDDHDFFTSGTEYWFNVTAGRAPGLHCLDVSPGLFLEACLAVYQLYCAAVTRSLERSGDLAPVPGVGRLERRAPPRRRWRRPSASSGTATPSSARTRTPRGPSCASKRTRTRS